MPRRLVRLLLRISGWLLTPLVLITAAAIGATVGLAVAPKFPANSALIVTVVLALAAATTGLVLWARMLRVHPELRHTLEMTVHGAPDSPIVQRLIHPDKPPSDPPA
jgi:hypothetical protein